MLWSCLMPRFMTWR